jgi:hypothetical protein
MEGHGPSWPQPKTTTPRRTRRSASLHGKLWRAMLRHGRKERFCRTGPLETRLPGKDGPTRRTRRSASLHGKTMEGHGPSWPQPKPTTPRRTRRSASLHGKLWRAMLRHGRKERFCRTGPLETRLPGKDGPTRRTRRSASLHLSGPLRRRDLFLSLCGGTDDTPSPDTGSRWGRTREPQRA